MTPEEKAVIDAARDYYWHDMESVDYHNALMAAMEELFRAEKASPPDPVPAEPQWVATTMLHCLAGDRIRIGAEETTVLKSNTGLWHADVRDAWRPRAWPHIELRMELEAVPGFQQYPPNASVEILCTPERHAVLMISEQFPGSAVISSDVD